MATVKEPLEKKKKTEYPVYQLKITLKRVRPPVWRRIQVPGGISFRRLHDVIQILMNWDDDHLHAFQVGGNTFGIPDPGGMWDTGEKDDRRFKLADAVTAEKSRFRYEYDFGDSWEVDLLVEKILPPDRDVQCPVCLAGKRSGPPEDCGGSWGYEELLEIVQTPDHDEHESMMEWLGDDFDPEAFDLTGINAQLRRLKK